MTALTTIQRRVLNATADDFEDLEQIYRSICLEFSSENFGASDRRMFYWRESVDAVPLAEIVEAIRLLVDQGLLSVRLPQGNTLAITSNDLSYLWRAWFTTTDAGRALLGAKRDQNDL
jgi:hypothetical protein